MLCRKLKLLRKPQNKKFDKIYNGARYIYNKTVFLLNETQDLYKIPNKYSNYSWLDTCIPRSEINESQDEKNNILYPTIRNTSESVFLSKLEIRNLLVPEETLSNVSVLNETPSIVREGAVFEAIKNFKSAKTNIKKGNINHFTMSYKRKKDIKSWTISIRRSLSVIDCRKKKIEIVLKKYKKFFNNENIYNILFNSCIEILDQKNTIDPFYRCIEDLEKILVISASKDKINDIIKSIMILLADEWTNKDKNRRKFNIFPSFTDNTVYETSEEIPEITNDSFIHYDGFDYYLLLPYEYNEVNKKGEYVIATDPGVRIYQTIYCPDGFIIRIGEGAGYKLGRIGSIVNKLSRDLYQQKGNKKSRKKIKRKITRLRKRMLCLQTELHNKTSNLLTKISKIICLPDFGVKKICKKDKRKIGKKVVRAMLALGHYKHKEQMKTKSVQNNCIILHTKEPYTTKQCGGCGSLENFIGKNEIYKCKSCKLVIGRDDTSSRNNLMCNIRHSIRV